MAASDIAEMANGLAGRGEVGKAYSLLLARSKSDPQASFTLAQWRMSGQVIRRDIGEARRLFGLAAKRGHTEALDCYIALLASGAGGIGRRWSKAVKLLKASGDPEHRRQLDCLKDMNIDADGDPKEDIASIRERVPSLIWEIPSFLTSAEARYLTSLALPRMQPSVVVHPATGELVFDPVRRSSAAAFPFLAENPVVHAINRRIAKATDTACEQGEPMQILGYERGQEYRTHSDAIANEPNQRILTFLVYLTEDFEGGETSFPKLDLAIRGKVGDALLFSNVDAAGRPEPSMVHAGLPVIRGRKLLLSKWIRKNPLDLRGAPDRPF